MSENSSTAGMSDNKRALHNAMERKRRDSIKVSSLKVLNEKEELYVYIEQESYANSTISIKFRTKKKHNVFLKTFNGDSNLVFFTSLSHFFPYQ